jgi:hypothetical protein
LPPLNVHLHVLDVEKEFNDLVWFVNFVTLINTFTDLNIGNLDFDCYCVLFLVLIFCTYFAGCSKLDQFFPKHFRSNCWGEAAFCYWAQLGRSWSKRFVILPWIDFCVLIVIFLIHLYF